jgi:signal transduction histidine kinase
VAADRSHAERRTFDLRESTEQIVVSLRPGLKSKPLTLAVEVPDNVIMDSYPGPYGQVLTNLVLNAVVHGFADGRSGTIIVRARQVDAHHVEITFVDDGAGMNEDVQRRVFDPFFTTRRTQGGTGLGLHIVYNLVTRQLGGRITLASAPDRGTTFRITLPLKAPREAPADSSPTRQMTSP